MQGGEFGTRFIQLIVNNFRSHDDLKCAYILAGNVWNT